MMKCDNGNLFLTFSQPIQKKNWFNEQWEQKRYCTPLMEANLKFCNR